jgi:hypothetical protein
MAILLTIPSLFLIFLVLVDSFESIVMPRRVTHRYRFSRLFYRSAWALWRRLALLIPAGKRREALLSVFGPLSLLVLFITWGVGLIVGFGMLHWALAGPLHAPDPDVGLTTYLYWSGTTFFTLGYGDITPASGFGRFLSVAEAGLGFGFLAVMISYLPVVYQAFSRREATISLLDARAGSPPAASEILIRLARSNACSAVDSFLADWERWSAELLESHLSFPVLSYYRSQHDNQSWLAGLTAVLDACTFLIAGVKGCNAYQAQLTFAMARHAAVDLALIFKVTPEFDGPERLSPDSLRQLRTQLQAAGLELLDGAPIDAKLIELRGMYEPFVKALARRFLFALPPIAPGGPVVDNWQRSAWMRRPPAIGSLPIAHVDAEHFK